MSLIKHWKFNKDEDIVLSNLEGLCRVNPSIGFIPSEKVVYNLESDSSEKIALISGGGAGHEPLHGGFVGENLLDAAVSGAIFASPSTKQILAAIKTKAHKDRGTLVVVKNYTGDILHFGLAVERAKNQGYKIEILPIGDDVAVGREQNAMVGRRGIAGVALVHKILGAITVKSPSLSLASLHKFGTSLNSNLVTLAASLDRTSVPGKSGEIEFTAHDEMELGLGIHNEPGVKISPIPNIDELCQKMFHMLLSPEDKERHYVDFDLKNDEFALCVNNIGGTSTFEMLAVTEHVYQNLPFSKRPKRVIMGDFVTSFNSPGFSITLLNLSGLAKMTDVSVDSLCEYLDTPTNAPGWRAKSYNADEWNRETVTIESPMKHHTPPKSELKMDKDLFTRCILSSMKKLLEKEPLITKYDTLVGDGDCGETLANGANSILKALKTDSFQKTLSDPVITLSNITELIEEAMGGTSGGIYSIYLTALVSAIQKQNELNVSTIASSLKFALYDGLFKYTKARVGGRTLVDTLQPFVDSLAKDGDISAALKAARNGCEATKTLKAKFGRASYVDDSEFKDGDIPDPGAVGLLAILEGFIEAM